MKRAAQSGIARMEKSTSSGGPGKLREVMVIAEEQGLLRGERNQVVRGRMPKAHLVPFPAQQALLFGDDHHFTELTRPANARAFSYSRSCRLSDTFHTVLLALLFCSTH